MRKWLIYIVVQDVCFASESCIMTEKNEKRKQKNKNWAEQVQRHLACIVAYLHYSRTFFGSSKKSFSCFGNNEYICRNIFC